MLVLNKKQLKAVLSFAGNKDVRHYLNGIYFDGKDLCATDGFHMAVISDQNAKEPKNRLSSVYTIHRSNVELVLKKMTAKDTCVLDIVDGIAVIKIGDSIISDQNSNCKDFLKYPDYQRVICQNQGAPERFNWYQPQFLQDLLDLVKALTQKSWWNPDGFMHGTFAPDCLGVRLNLNDCAGQDVWLHVAIMSVRMQ